MAGINNQATVANQTPDKMLQMTNICIKQKTCRITKLRFNKYTSSKGNKETLLTQLCTEHQPSHPPHLMHITDLKVEVLHWQPHEVLVLNIVLEW